MRDPAIMLYLSLMFTSATAAFAARDAHHEMLARCYVANSLIYSLLGVCHCVGL